MSHHPPDPASQSPSRPAAALRAAAGSLFWLAVAIALLVVAFLGLKAAGSRSVAAFKRARTHFTGALDNTEA